MDAAVKFVEEQPKVAVGIIFGLLILLLGNIILSLNNKPAPAKKPRVNHTIKLSDEKVVDKVPCGEIENIAQFKDGKLVMCRCWKSKTFPYCDGAHNEHNKSTGDNVGPLIITK